MNEKFTGRKSKNEKSRTDFDYLDRVTDEEIDKAIKDDPDTLTLDDCDMTQLRVVYKKTNDLSGVWDGYQFERKK